MPRVNKFEVTEKARREREKKRRAPNQELVQKIRDKFPDFTLAELKEMFPAVFGNDDYLF